MEIDFVRDNFFGNKFLVIIITSYFSFSQNPIIPNKGVNDPHIRIIDNKAYLAASHDRSPKNKTFVMDNWWLWSSENLVDWQLVKTLTPEETYIGKPYTKCWATDIVKRDDKYYWYFSVANKNSGVVVADNPVGPWVDPLGEPFLKDDLTPTLEYDMGIFEDLNGDFFIVFGIWDFYIAKLNDDMISLAEKPRKIVINNPRGPYNLCGVREEKRTDDKPFIHYYNQKYYLSWGCFYAMSDNVYGPYDYKGSIIENNSFSHGYDSPTWPNGFKQGRHGSFFQWHNQWYFAYCDMSQTGNRYFRDTFISYIHYKENGEISPIRVDGIGVGNYDINKGHINAVDYFKSFGTKKIENTDGTFSISDIQNNDFLVYNSIKGLSGKKTIEFTGSFHYNLIIEARLDSPEGKLIGAFNVSQNNQINHQQFSFKPIDNPVNLCFVFKGKQHSLLDLKRISFK